MHTELLPAGDDLLHSPAILKAAELLKQGQVVAFPTETVYGLGANAMDPEAVSRIYKAKGRPSHNPLIVHVSDISASRALAAHWPESAEILATALWPGPITLVVKKNPAVPGITTAGGDTVGLRVPAHPVARALISACGFPLAAPSANRSNYISPTTAAHVIKSLADRIPMVLDGGPCSGGIESTVVDLTGPVPRILRPGLYSTNFLSALVGQKFESIDSGNLPKSPDRPLLSPGQLDIHYAPRTPLVLLHASDIAKEISKYNRVGLMVLEETPLPPTSPSPVTIRQMATDHETYARELFATLHDLDAQNLDVILCELPPETPEWLGIQDRLRRAGKPHR